MFCQLFESEEHGQILVRYESGPPPAYVISFQADGLLLDLRVEFTDDEKGDKAADKAMREATLESMEKLVAGVKRENGFSGKGED